MNFFNYKHIIHFLALFYNETNFIFYIKDFFIWVKIKIKLFLVLCNYIHILIKFEIKVKYFNEEQKLFFFPLK